MPPCMGTFVSVAVDAVTGRKIINVVELRKLSFRICFYLNNPVKFAEIETAVLLAQADAPQDLQNPLEQFGPWRVVR